MTAIIQRRHSSIGVLQTDKAAGMAVPNHVSVESALFALRVWTISVPSARDMTDTIVSNSDNPKFEI
jgi:hypothetical protein